MKIYSVGAQEPLGKHLEEIRKSRNPSMWRCFVTKLHKDLYLDPYAQRIALNFIEENYKDFEVYEFSFYWLKTGHVFLLFQGRMKKAHDTFKKFLDFVSENENAANAAFEIYDMGKQFDRVEGFLKEALEEINAPPEPVKIERGSEEEKETTVREETCFKSLIKERSLRIKPLLLLVEDERMTQAFISALLENYCDIVPAKTLEEARNLYKTLWPDMVFMDIELPDGDGQDLTEEFMLMDPQAYIIMVSGCISNEKIERCKKAGVKGFIAKPVTSDKDRLMQQVFHYNQHKKTIRLSPDS